MLWWSPPKQRQRWGESAMLPSGNWGQIFFDLFYVGGAYNLGNIIKYSSNSQGILYFSGAAFPAMMMWFDKLYYDARFTTRPGHDSFHRMLEVVQLCCVATALSRARNVEVLADPCSHVDMFQFAGSIFLFNLVAIWRYVEVIFFGVGDPAARIAARRDILWVFLPTLCLLAATIESGYYFFVKGKTGGDFCDWTHRPILFCLSSWVSRVVIGYIVRVQCLPKEKRVEMTVPMDIHFCKHRYGEWFMLMFGESIVSLLIVDSDNESANHAVAFYSGILSVMFLAHLHFRSEPKDHDHALSRSRHGSFFYTVMVPIYSCALIAIGVSYKIFLYDFMYENGGYHQQRLLGGSDSSSNYQNDYLLEKQQFTANLFSASIATVLICTDLLVLLHKGFAAVFAYARSLPKATLTVLVLLKYSLVVLLAALSTFQTDPHVMTFCGLGAILAQEFLRNAFLKGQTGCTDDAKDDATTATGASNCSYTSQIFNYHMSNEDVLPFERDVSGLTMAQSVVSNVAKEAPGVVDKAYSQLEAQTKNREGAVQVEASGKVDKVEMTTGYSDMGEF